MQWPRGVDDNGVGIHLLPVEIYESIAKYLSRTDVQNMRLVNHEFDSKICQVLFKVVVVPFKSEIYGIALDTENALMPNSVMLQDQGMRVFQGYAQTFQVYSGECANCVLSQIRTMDQTFCHEL